MHALITFVIAFILLMIVRGVLSAVFQKTAGPDHSEGNSGHDGDGGIPKGKIRASRFAGKYSWTWMQTAGALNLSFVRPEKSNGWPAIRGSIRDMIVSVNCNVPAAGSPSTCCRVYFKRSFPARLEICTRGRQTESGQVSLRSVLGTEKEPELSASFDNAELFREYLTPECRAFLSAGYEAYPFVRINDSCFEVRYPGIFNETEQFTEQLKAVTNAAGFFSDMAEKMSKPKLQRQTAPRNAAPVQPAPPSGHETAAQTASGGEPPAQEQKPVVPPAGEKLPAETPAEEKTFSLDKETLLPKLWASSFPGDRERQLFEQIRGQSVEWEGTLKTAYDYASDFVFGNGNGIKASFELMEFKPAGSALRIAVKAVVSLPRENSELLRKSGGKTFRFRGTLLKFEPVAREIYLSGGELLNN